ncbi:MAG: diguanylate cyclase [Clostridia bacterium]
MTGTQLQTKRDQLTGLHIREWAIHRIDKIIRQKQPIWIALLDIDFFTIINEKLGWKTGDQVLVKIAELIRRYEPIEAARYGGDEFILLVSRESRMVSA